MEKIKKESFDSIIENASRVAREEMKKIKDENTIWQSEIADPQFHTKTVNHNLYISEFNHLSTKMKEALISKKRGYINNINISTEKALLKRKLVDDSGKLTTSGVLLAIGSMSLVEQCELIGAKYREVEKEYNERVELSVLRKFLKEEWYGSFSEGKIIFELLNSIALLPIIEVAKRAFDVKEKQEYEIIGCSIFNNFCNSLKQKIIDRIRNIDENELKENYDYIKRIKQKRIFNLGYGIISFGGESPHKIDFTTKEIITLFDDISREDLEIIANLCMNGSISPTGWPDLIIHRNKEYKMIEVKRHDKLILSQIITISTLIKKKIEVYVFKTK